METTTRRLLECIDELIPLVTEPRFVSHLLRCVTHLVPIDHTAISITVSERMLPVFEGCGYGETPRRLIDAFSERYCRLIPAALAFPLSDAITPVDWRAFEDTEFVTDFVAPQGIRYGMAIQVGDGVRNPMRVLQFYRTRRSRAFRDRELALAALLQPHLVNLLAIHERLRSLEAQVVQPAELQDRCRRLSRREAEVAALLCTRLTVPEIATHLLVSPRTVETHVAHLYEKLGVCNRSELIRALRRQS